MKHLCTLVLMLLLLMAGAHLGAQNPVRSQRETIKGQLELGTLSKSGVSKLSDPMNYNDKSLPEGYGKYNDNGLKDLDKAMEDRDWKSEDTAWARATAANTTEAYQRYIVQFPHGAHIAEASTRLIDLKIEYALNNAHDELPNIEHTDSDENKETSTFVIQNNTEYQLTVLISGPDYRSVTINPGLKTVITLSNGDYKLAASVPPPGIRPYAGKTTFEGGRYDVGFWVVHN